jgi:hypothetical protein
MKLLKSEFNLFFLLLTGVFILLFANCGGKDEQEGSLGINLEDPQKKSYVIIEIEDSEYLNSDFEKYVRGTFGNDQTSISISRRSLFCSQPVIRTYLCLGRRNKSIWQNCPTSLSLKAAKSQ